MRARIIDILSVCASKELWRSSQVFWQEYRTCGDKRIYRVWNGRLFRIEKQSREALSNPFTHDPGDPLWCRYYGAYRSPWPGIYPPGYAEVFWERKAWENDSVPGTDAVAEILDRRYLRGLLIIRLSSPKTIRNVFWQLQMRNMYKYPERSFQPCDLGRSFFWHEHRMLVVACR